MFPISSPYLLLFRFVRESITVQSCLLEVVVAHTGLGVPPVQVHLVSNVSRDATVWSPDLLPTCAQGAALPLRHVLRRIDGEWGPVGCLLCWGKHLGKSQHFILGKFSLC